MNTIGIIGFGNMGEAIAAGLNASDLEYTLGVMETDPVRAEIAVKDYGGKLLSSYSDLFAFANITIIAIKPQDLATLLSDIGNAAEGKQIITLVAGRKISFFIEKLRSPHIARFMPNIAAKIQRSVVGVSFAPDSSDDLHKNALKIAASVGEPVNIPEQLMSGITGLSGSGIAYVFAFCHALALGGIAVGIPYPQALTIAIETVKGAGDMLEASLNNETGGPIDLITRVCSPGGTTIQGIKTLEKEGFAAAIIHAVEDAAEKAAEMEG